MGRAVLAEPDRVVGHHIDDADPHERRQPDRRAGIIGKGQKGPAIGDQPAMHGDAVHRRRHPVLAHPVTDDSGRRSRRGGRPSGPWPWCCSTGSDRPSRRPARARPGSGCRAPCPRPGGSRSWRSPAGNRRRAWRWHASRPGGSSLRCRRRNSARRSAGRDASRASQARRTASPRAPAARHSARTSSGITKGG